MKKRVLSWLFIFVFATEGTLISQAAADEKSGIEITDKVLKYEELADLIHKNNPDVGLIVNSYERTLQDYEDTRNLLKSYQSDANANKTEAKNNGNMEEYAYYASEEAIFDSAAASYQKMVDELKRPSGTLNQRKTERQITAAAQSLMISYDTLRLQLEIWNQKQAVYENEYQLSVKKEQVGTGLPTDRQTAEALLLSAKASQITLEEQMGDLYDSLCLMTGLEVGGNIIVQRISSFDDQVISSMNLEIDTKKAIGNNETLINDRHTTESNSTPGRNNKQRIVADGEERLTVEMKRLYEDVMQKYKELKVAQAEYNDGLQKQADNHMKYQTGFISQQEYLDGELEVMQIETELSIAHLVLRQAADTYGWAVLGMVSI